MCLVEVHGLLMLYRSTSFSACPNSYSIHPPELIPRVLPQILETLQSISGVFPGEANPQHGVSMREWSIASLGLFLGFATNFDFCYFERGTLMLTC